MKEPVQLGFDYSALDAPTRGFVQERVERIRNLARMTAASIVQIGQYLTEVKERLGHGKFLEWIEREFAWSEDSAQRFMRVHDQFKNRNLRNLDIDVSALYLIAAPKTPEPVREDIIRRAGNGEAVTHQLVRAAVQRFEETGEMPEIHRPLREILREVREARQPEPDPVPVVTPEMRRQENEIRQEMKRNSDHAVALMSVMHAIECLNDPPLSMAGVAKEIRRLDTPSKNWPQQAKNAAKTLEDLLRRLNV